jgi:dihydroneopterin aldolase/2-amino-4-hydroxy-6-hydroxymethyldihydropteridine diphosphokinase/dihydropteroate synthase
MANGQRDVIRINDLSLGVSLANASSWSSDSGKPKARPVLVTLSLLYDLRGAGDSDDLSQSISYSSIYSALTRASTSDYSSLEVLLDHIFAVAFDTYPSVEEVDVKIVLTKFPLHCKAAGIEAGSLKGGVRTRPNRFFLEDLICHGIIGVNPQERVQKQTICLNISYSSREVFQTRFDFGDLARRTYKVCH